MRSSELRLAVTELRRRVDDIRRVGCTGAKNLGSLMKELQRTAREVEAWGAELNDSCALAAAQEAYQLVNTLRHPCAAEAMHPGRAAAVVCVQLQHDPGLDRNDIARDLKQAIFSSISREPPLRPVTFSVGLLPLDPDAFAAWLRVTPQCPFHHTTLAPMLVTFTARSIPLSSVDFIGYLEDAASPERLDVPWRGRMGAAVVPLDTQAIARLERRCLGPLLNGDVGSRP